MRPSVLSFALCLLGTLGSAFAAPSDAARPTPQRPALQGPQAPIDPARRVTPPGGAPRTPVLIPQRVLEPGPSPRPQTYRQTPPRPPEPPRPPAPATSPRAPDYSR